MRPSPGALHGTAPTVHDLLVAFDFAAASAHRLHPSAHSDIPQRLYPDLAIFEVWQNALSTFATSCRLLDNAQYKSPPTADKTGGLC
jgi:hypothetical protein